MLNTQFLKHNLNRKLGQYLILFSLLFQSSSCVLLRHTCIMFPVQEVSSTTHTCSNEPIKLDYAFNEPFLKFSLCMGRYSLTLLWNSRGNRRPFRTEFLIFTTVEMFNLVIVVRIITFSDNKRSNFNLVFDVSIATSYVGIIKVDDRHFEQLLWSVLLLSLLS